MYSKIWPKTLYYSTGSYLKIDSIMLKYLKVLNAVQENGCILKHRLTFSAWFFIKYGWITTYTYSSIKNTSTVDQNSNSNACTFLLLFNVTACLFQHFNDTSWAVFY